MKLFCINLFFVLTPVTLGLLGFLYPPLWFFASLSAIATGIFQVVTGFTLFIAQPKNPLLIIYLLFTLAFFLLWHCTGGEWILAMPPALAIYMSVIIYLNRKPKT